MERLGGFFVFGFPLSPGTLVQKGGREQLLQGPSIQLVPVSSSSLSLPRDASSMWVQALPRCADIELMVEANLQGLSTELE